MYEWIPRERVFAHGAEEYSATLSAVRAIKAKHGGLPLDQAEARLYYLV
jgi:hypothetical protein